MDELKLYEAINMVDRALIKDAEMSADTSAQTDNEDAVVVTGVTVHRRSIWRKAAAAAAMVLFIGGAGAAGYVVMRNAPAVPPDANEAMPLIATDPYTEGASTEPDSTAPCTKVLTDEKKAEAEHIQEECRQDTADEAEKARKKAVEEQSTISAAMQEEELQQSITSEGTKQAEAELKAEEEQIEKEIQEAFQQPPVSPAEPAEIPTTAPAIPYTDRWPSTPCTAELCQLLDSLTYVPETCDGLPEFALQADNGTLYQINMSGSGWVWRRLNGIEEAQMTEEVRSALQAFIETNRITPYVWN